VLDEVWRNDVEFENLHGELDVNDLLNQNLNVSEIADFSIDRESKSDPLDMFLSERNESPAIDGFDLEDERRNLRVLNNPPFSDYISMTDTANEFSSDALYFRTLRSEDYDASVRKLQKHRKQIARSSNYLSLPVNELLSRIEVEVIWDLAYVNFNVHLENRGRRKTKCSNS
jgi:hypothetical protein